MSTAIRPIVQPVRLTMDQAFRESLDIVISGLQARGEQWSSEAKQDMVSTLFLSAQKLGHLDMWQAPRPEAVVLDRPAAPVPELKASPAAAPVPAPAAAAAAPQWFRSMLTAFAAIADELPPEVYQTVLEWHGFQSLEAIRPEDRDKAIACYLTLKSAREDYKRKAADPTSFEHFQATEGF
jgi:hypothetical protein